MSSNGLLKRPLSPHFNDQTVFHRVLISPTPTKLLGASDECITPFISTNIEGDNNDPNISANESDEEKLRREFEESERLAWEIMRQESEEAYRIQMEFLRNNQNNIDDEDFSLLEAIVLEETQNSTIQQEQGGEEEEEEEEDIDSWDYERLLELGQVLGDVKTERWRRKAKSVIDNLPIVQIVENQIGNNITDVLNVPHTDEDSTQTIHLHTLQEPQCIICMENFVIDEQMMILPCRHYFHNNCCTTWLTDHNSCPKCKTAIVKTPSK